MLRREIGTFAEPTTRSMSVTIRDVASRAGVSISTVSRVLNGTSPVREEKRQLVLEAADALGYSPNPAALSLLNKKTGGLGVLLPFVGGEFFSELLNGMDEAAQELGMFLLVSTSHRQPGEFRKAIAALDKRVDGLVVMAPELAREEAASLLRTKTPVVFLNTDARGLAADVFNFDNHAGARALTEHLLRGGHERIALIAGPRDAHDARERLRGYTDAMAAAGLPTEGLVFSGGFTREAGFASAMELLEVTPRPTAILAANDYCALGAISALHQVGVEIPDEIAVCGFDGLASAAYSVPPLTTAQVPVQEIGYRAIRRLAARLDGSSSAHEQQVVPVDLVIRGSSAPAPETVEA